LKIPRDFASPGTSSSLSKTLDLLHPIVGLTGTITWGKVEGFKKTGDEDGDEDFLKEMLVETKRKIPGFLR